MIVDVKFVNAGAPRMMLIDSGAPKSVVSTEWIEGYLKDVKVSEEEIKKKTCNRPHLYLSTHPLMGCA